MPPHERHTMSDTITEAPTETVEAPETPTETVEEAPLGETGLSALKAEREARAAAEKRLKEFEDRDKTEAEKTAERLAAAEKRAEELEARSTRAEVAATKSVPTALLAGPASGSAEDLAKFADALIQFRGDQGSNGLHVPNEGKSPNVEVSEDKKFLGEFFGSGD